MSPSSTSIPPETVLGETYRVLREIGSGGMGRVYEAVHSTLGRRVAIKHLHARLAQDEQAVLRFRREAELAASLEHDNICQVHDIGTAQDGALYLVMPLLAGCSLKALLRREGGLSTHRLVDIVRQTLSALHAAHRAGIIHRDLKPDNIFVTTMGDRQDFVKLLDFGISKIKVPGASSVHLTKPGAVLGTPHYMSPEQAQGIREIDHRTDIYAMGVILYEGLTGVRPFVAETYGELLLKIRSNPFDAPSDVNPLVHPEMERIVLTSMARHPDDRFSDAEEMSLALGEAQLAALESPVPPEGARASTWGTIETRETDAGALSEPPPKQIACPTRRRKGIIAGMVIVLLMGVAVIGLAVKLLREHEAIPPVTVAIPPPPAMVEEAEPPPPPKGSPAEPREERASAPEIAPAGDVEAAAPAAIPKQSGIAEKQIKKRKKPHKKAAVEEAPAEPKSLKGRFGTEIDLNYNE